MNVLVLNAGSGSQMCSLFQVGTHLSEKPLDPVWEARVETTSPRLKINERLLTLRIREKEEKQQVLHSGPSSKESLVHLLTMLWEGESPAVSGPGNIDVVGHRVVHGGTEFDGAVVVNKHVEAAIERLAAFAPLHNPRNLEGIRVAREFFGSDTPQVAVFDTSFHRSLSDAAVVYPEPYDWLSQGIRRYGFHGTSFRWASQRAAHLLKRKGDPDLRLIICHLGGGCSLAATIGGRSVDTTMGFTPLDGIAMCTRPGTLDPGILLFLMKQDPDLERLEEVLNKECGLKGLSGLPGDTRILLAEALKGDEKARLAMNVFVHRLQGGIGQMMASLGGCPDAIVFTDAIGEDEPVVRAQACQPFQFLGLEIDPEQNQRSPLDADISTRASKVRVLIVKSREDWQIARDCHRLIQILKD
jgi:acetate kinase